ncbi:heterokaryon incompatibility protein [Colletotrichum nymphaeae SA-01]|uniref:Heterokaryon incompatibility protein n=1 Tax=Colletotrichum nymphaeae SA-01 TaxID=1460502 RepID=A0A135ULS9_9PEZI|nr:heterokaryon incompatibility protein [Colletotrichum nymphaeae SA-01]
MLCQVCLNGLEGFRDPSKVKRVGYRDEIGTPVLTPDPDEIAKAVAFPPFGKSFHNGKTQYDACSEIEMYAFAHHPTKMSWLQSKSEGCDICREIIAYEQTEVTPDDDVSTFPKVDCFTTFLVKVEKAEHGNTFVMIVWQGTRYCRWHRWKSCVDEPQTLRFNDSIGHSTKDEVTWSIIENWIRDCTEDHRDCNPVSLKEGNIQQKLAAESLRDISETHRQALPSRLLKLEVVGQRKTFRLVTKQEIVTQTSYATLSHCWGTKPWDMNLILNQINLTTLSTPQPVTMLPKTFRDAFIVLERLQLEYLWIDRFCIFQDSEDDWLVEASDMHNFYRNSFVCISALGAEDDDGGLFFSRDPLAISIPVVNIPIGESNQSIPHAGMQDVAFIRDADFKSAALSKRGWVLQERILAPRVLHFGKSQIFWECKTSVCSEAQPNFDKWKCVPVLLAHPNYKRRTVWKTTIGSDPPSFENPIDCIFIEWYRLLDYYNQCHLTESKDKLVAISAIAKDMKQHLTHLGESAIYLGGLWRSRMPRNLLWQVFEPANRPERYRAPSWSWASVDNTSLCSYHKCYSDYSKPHRVLVSVVEAATTPLTSDDTGQLQGGSLTLKCRLLRAIIAPILSSRPHEGWVGVERLETIEGTHLHHQQRDRSGYLPRGFNADTVEDERCGPVCFVPIQVEEFDKAGGADVSRVCGIYYGLVLEKSGAGYRRIGMLRYDIYEPKLMSWFDELDIPWGDVTIE